MNAKINKNNFADAIIYTFLLFLTLLFVLPFYNVLIVSFSNIVEVKKHIVYLFPTSFDLSAYTYIFGRIEYLRAFITSIGVTTVGTALNMLVTFIGGYVLSKKQLPGRRVFIILIIITMLFNGGLIPYYLTLKNLHLVNSYLVMVLPMAINTFYLIIFINYFRTIPPSLEESAKLDGANELLILFRIILPVSLPTFAAIMLFYSVDRWNEWWHAMIFINNVKMYPFQLLLRETIVNYEQVLRMKGGASVAQNLVSIYPDSLKMAVVVVASVPVLLVYPFLQRYFVMGIMVGSIKE